MTGLVDAPRGPTRFSHDGVRDALLCSILCLIGWNLVSPRPISTGNASSGTAIHAQGRFNLALDSKSFFIPAEKFVQLHDKDSSSHGPFDRTTELRALGIGTLFGAIIMGDPGGDIEPVTRSSW